MRTIDHTTAERFVATLTQDNLNSLAALKENDDEFNELVVNGYPPERRQWAIQNHLVEKNDAGRLIVTDYGRRVIELAAEQCPEPYADVTLKELLAHTQRTVDGLLQNSPVELVPAEEHVQLPQRIGAVWHSLVS